MEKIQWKLFADYLKPRTKEWHKGLSGHVLVIGGEVGFSGAVRMAAEAALRIGAGLVSIATRAEHAALMNVSCPEIMCHAVENAKQLAPLLEKATAIIIGPGLGQHEWGATLWKSVSKLDKPVLVDADALNLLAKHPITKLNWVLTPHPGEAGRLLDMTTAEVQEGRQAAAEMILKLYGGVCVLKGSGTLIASEDNSTVICDKGNPGMASAGMGDILSGVIGGLLAQGLPTNDAAKLGVLIHAMAGDLAAKAGERGMIATDLLPHLRGLVN